MKRFILSAIFMTAPLCAGAWDFTDGQMKDLSCAEKKMQLMYYYFAPAKEANIANYTLECGGQRYSVKMPRWVENVLPEMQNKKVWRDPTEGDLSEAALWQTPVSILYEFFDLTKKTFPVSNVEPGIAPLLLVKEYSDIRVRYQMALDRIYRARLFNSMEGRGRSMLSYLELSLREMDSIADGLSNANIPRFVSAVNGVSYLSQSAFDLMFAPPRQYKTELPKTGLWKIMPLILMMAGVLIILVGLVYALTKYRDNYREAFVRFVDRAKAWTEVFNRQFLKVKVRHLMAAPIAIFTLAGILTFNFLGFIILTALGIYVGVHMPGWSLDYLKKNRGKKIDTQLMDALILLSNSLKSGLDIVQGFEMVAHDLQPPISEEFALVLKNYQLGTPFEKALAGLENRAFSRLLVYMIKAIILQRQVGGNLTKVFERIVENIREESKLEEKTKALTAQQKIQSVVVGVMPWLMLIVMFLFQGKVMAEFYFSPLGVAVLAFCIFWISIGMVVVQKLSKVTV
ncbi:MAG: type II secretion system F family protein [Elusimicrobia bacterium]|nr:type II secretion system F family protein [Elusimicrobiota bacterium]